jgi:uncharacterized protein (TIGR03083 family)
MAHWEAIREARLSLADTLDSLPADAWAKASLCGSWTIRQLVGHLVSTHTTSRATFALEVAKARGSFDRANDRVSRREGERPPADLVADFRRVVIDSRSKPPFFGSEAPLTDILIHALDIRIPLDLPTDRPVEPYRHVLDLFISSKGRIGFVPKKLPDVRFSATDLDWSHGSGATVNGSAADLVLAISGRRVRFDVLSGAGAATLAAWMPS